jgi:spore coat polysaccharide biosynthesis protein SpsF
MFKTSLIIQARLGSKRLEGKTLMPLAGEPLIYRIVERVKRCTQIDNLILAIPDTEQDDKISKINFSCNIKIFKGSENNLVSRFFFAAKKFNSKIIVRLPGDNCMPEPSEIDKVILFYKKFKNPFFASNLSNILNNQYPDGIGAEVFGFNYLDDLMNMKLTKEQKEHIHLNFFDYKNDKAVNKKWCKVRTIICPKEFRRPEICLDVNTIEDYKFISDIYENLYYIKPKFKITDIINYLDKKNEKKQK